MSKNITLIQFSSRKEGNCSAIAKHIKNYYAADNVSSFVIDANIAQPCNNCDYECLMPGKECPGLNDALQKIMDTICSSDLAYFIVPNFCGYPCANYFAFNERSVGYFNMNRELMQKYMAVPKRFVIVSNSEGDSFKNAMMQQVDGNPDMLYLKTGKLKSTVLLAI